MKYSTKNPPIVCMQTTSTCYKNASVMPIRGILWHSTGANNPNLKRYVQPSDNASNRAEMLKLLGTNNNGNDWNHIYRTAGLNAWIGKLANGEVTSIQTMPWNYTPWGCGSGRYGSCNNGWIQFEICEDNLKDPIYFNAVYKEACELTAYLCKIHNIDPKGTVYYAGRNVPTILCHYDSYNLGLGSNHGDIYHWFKLYGKDMNTVRNDVATLLQEKIEPPKVEVKEEEEVTQADFNKMMETYLADLAKKEASSWSKDARAWAEGNGLISGDSNGNRMYKKFITREEMVSVLQRALSGEMTESRAEEYLKELATKNPSSWSAQARSWAERKGLISGDSNGNKMYKKPLTREELVSILYRLHGEE